MERENPKSKAQRPRARSIVQDFSRYDQKLEFILRTAARIFAEKNYHSTSMRDIARATGVSLSGLYHYCKSKEELLFLIQDNCFGRVLERLEQRLSGAAGPEQKLRIFVENHLAFFASNMAEMKVLSHEADSLGRELHQRVAAKKERYTKLARRILAEVQQQKPEAEAPINLTVATYALFGMMNWIYNWYDPHGKLSVADLVDNVMRLYLGGFLNESPETLDGPIPTVSERLSIWREPNKKTA